ncbi:MAG: dialkylresorcinol condensing enzyme [Neisseriaceae bacterium]|nr:dialkylresorcinol condensing enzyme [Neisseriaceae bacterium]
MNKKRILIVYYSQTGQLRQMVENFAAPLLAADDIEVEMLPIKPQTPFAFPWRFLSFFNAFPETVHFQPCAIEPIRTQHNQYDLIILAYTVWFLSPSQPITAFLQDETAQKLLKNTPVATIIGCRNMWLMANLEVKKMLSQVNAHLIGNMVKIDACSSAASFITTPLWLLTGKKQAFGLPAAGISDTDIADCRRFGDKTRTVLLSGSLNETMWQNMGAVKVNENLIASEKIARRSFYLWGKLLISSGKISPLIRKFILLFYIVFLILMILTVVPVSAVIKMLIKPLTRQKIDEQKKYFAAPSGE